MGFVSILDKFVPVFRWGVNQCQFRSVKLIAGASDLGIRLGDANDWCFGFVVTADGDFIGVVGAGFGFEHGRWR